MRIETGVTSAGPSFAAQLVGSTAPTPQPLQHCLTSKLAFHAPLVECAGFEIWCASSGLRRLRGDGLLRRMYASRGYKHGCGSTDASDEPTLTLQACRGDEVFGTITVRLDSIEGLAADALYRHEIDGYRSAGASVCEVTRLAVSDGGDSKPILASLFHVGYLFFGGIKRVRTDHVAVMTYIEPVSAVLFAALLLHEPLTLTTVAGGAMVVLGGLLVTRIEALEPAPIETAGVEGDL